MREFRPIFAVIANLIRQTDVSSFCKGTDQTYRRLDSTSHGVVYWVAGVVLSQEMLLN